MNPLVFNVIRNIMSGEGFEGGAYSGEWISAWISIAILGLGVFFLLMAQRNEILPIPFHVGGGLIGIFIAILIIMFTGASKIALGVGALGVIAGGYLVGSRFE